jgi:predicted deacetylase
MPETFNRVLRILALAEDARVPPPTLLVVPGKNWTPELLDTLRALARRGHRLAGHGWIHKAPSQSRTLFHRAHSLLISRNEAEHLSLPREEVEGLVRRCHDWFSTVDLPTPELYVPPAWALGALPLDSLASLPFRWYEILRGFVDGPSGRVRWLPLAGFEADTTFRALSLRVWNGLNAWVARRVRGPLRISIHPGDLDLLLKRNVERMLEIPWRYVEEEEASGIETGLPSGGTKPQDGDAEPPGVETEPSGEGAEPLGECAESRDPAGEERP